MCEVLGVSRSGYYKWLNRPKSNQKERKEKLTSQIKRVYLDSRRNYGSPKITKQLNSEGVSVSQKTVSRIMKEEGIRSKTVKKYKATTNSKHNLPVYPNLLDQQFKVERPGQAWVADITYIWTSEGWLYLATIMELYSRRIIGWAMDERMTKELGDPRLKTSNQNSDSNSWTHSSFRSWEPVCVEGIPTSITN